MGKMNVIDWFYLQFRPRWKRISRNLEDVERERERGRVGNGYFVEKLWEFDNECYQNRDEIFEWMSDWMNEWRYEWMNGSMVSNKKSRSERKGSEKKG